MGTDHASVARSRIRESVADSKCDLVATVYAWKSIEVICKPTQPRRNSRGSKLGCKLHIDHPLLPELGCRGTGSLQLRLGLVDVAALGVGLLISSLSFWEWWTWRRP